MMETPWQNITTVCEDAANQLSDKEPMVFSPSFSLFEAMSALELMDPHMDQLMGLKEPLNVNKLFHVQFPASLSESSLVKLFQLLANLEVGFLEGSSISETTHSFILIWEEAWPHISSDASELVTLLVKYGKHMHMSCANINHAVLAADVYEEEDFSQCSSNPTLNTELSSVDLSTSASHSQELGQLIRYRLNWTQCSQAIRGLVQFGMLVHAHPRNEANDVLISGLIGQLSDTAQNMLNSIAELEHSIKSGSLCGGLTTAGMTDADVSFAFNDLLIRRLHLNPARKVSTRSFADCLLLMKTLCAQLVEAARWMQTLVAKSDVHFDELLAVCFDQCNRRLHVLTRSVLVACLRYRCENMNSIVMRSLEVRHFPEALMRLPLLVDRWLASLGRACWDALRALFTHRHKLHTRFEVLFVEWTTVCNDAPFVDNQYYVSSLDAAAAKKLSKSTPAPEMVPWFRFWTLNIVTQLMDAYLALLMEMELVALPELDYFYWYWDFICHTRCWVLERFRAMELEAAQKAYDEASAAYQQQQAQLQRDKSKKRSKGAPSLVAPVEPSPLPTSVDELCMKVKGQLCRGQSRMMLAATALGLSGTRGHSDVPLEPDAPAPTVVPHTQYSSWAGVFRHRFGAFVGLHNPPFLSFEEFQESLAARSKDKDRVMTMIEEANVSFSNAKKVMEFVRKNVNDGGAGCFSDAAESKAVSKELKVLEALGGGSSLVASSAADKAAKSYCVANFKIAVANTLGSVKSSTLMKQKGVDSPNPPLSVCIDRTHNAHFPVIEFKAL